MSNNEPHIHYFARTGWNLCCKQATYLTLKKEEVKKLSFKEELALKLHMAICKFCRAFRKQSEMMNQMILKAGLQSGPTMQEDVKNKLKALVISNLNKN